MNCVFVRVLWLSKPFHKSNTLSLSIVRCQNEQSQFLFVLYCADCRIMILYRLCTNKTEFIVNSFCYYHHWNICQKLWLSFSFGSHSNKWSLLLSLDYFHIASQFIFIVVFFPPVVVYTLTLTLSMISFQFFPFSLSHVFHMHFFLFHKASKAVLCSHPNRTKK